MKSLQAIFCAAFLLVLTLACAYSDNRVESKYLPRVKCVELFGKCFMKITDKSNLISEAMELKRVKRNIFANGKCAKRQVWFRYRCWDCQVYTKLTGNDC